MENKVDYRLEKLAKYLEGKICKELKPVKKYYQLIVFTGIFSDEVRITRYPVPDPRTALIIIDVLCSEFDEKGYEKSMFALQCRADVDEEWQDWVDYHGNTICDYDLNENFTLIPPY